MASADWVLKAQTEALETQTEALETQTEALEVKLFSTKKRLSQI